MIENQRIEIALVVMIVVKMLFQCLFRVRNVHCPLLLKCALQLSTHGFHATWRAPLSPPPPHRIQNVPDALSQCVGRQRRRRRPQRRERGKRFTPCVNVRRVIHARRECFVDYIFSCVQIEHNVLDDFFVAFNAESTKHGKQGHHRRTAQHRNDTIVVVYMQCKLVTTVVVVGRPNEWRKFFLAIDDQITANILPTLPQPKPHFRR